ncbi:MAG: sugar transferase [Clostridia bacterium]|nr:sugar transferase [Clostridia bacterium]MBR5903251.1 sugar transferase [Clostridia bacterium]
MYQTYIKRGFDIVLAVFGICFFALPMAVIALVIKLDDPGTVLFRQQRVGKGKRLFTMYKFRTMKTAAPKDCPTHLLRDPGAYITGVGRFLRRSSLDELPQLFNILLGHMSFVGPRPALWNQQDLIAKRDSFGANALRPGLTGWAQINGRDELPIEQKAALDGEYAAKIGFLFDCRCFFGTFLAVVSARGVHEGSGDKKDVQK